MVARHALAELTPLRVVHLDIDTTAMPLFGDHEGALLGPNPHYRRGDSMCEIAGEAMLLARGVSPALARVCLPHAQWDRMSVSFEELLVALADKLWKGVRKVDLEERVIDAVAEKVGTSRWEVFVTLDSLFEEIAAEGDARLERRRRGAA
ncbi:phosphohydrolase [Chondromyces crocatus]|uniref:Uncharacterized protein n=1 Tax=Chondromyces crocatus TaxID=52 RepID=A0A0K1EFJ6_CHOCO|nr:phosphohydrolase [Chondromyces crocatus]AKT39614.1 uncharacterized protein CMC5_037630 [Chondromyces crocatus]